MRISVEDCKNITAIKSKVRVEMTALIEKFLKETFEEVEGDVLQIGTNKIAVACAEAPDEDGFMVDVCCVVTPEVKSWTHGKGVRGTEPFDRFQENQDWLDEVKCKEAKRKKKGDNE